MEKTEEEKRRVEAGKGWGRAGSPYHPTQGQGPSTIQQLCVGP